VALKPQDVIVETYAIQQGGFMLKPASGVRLIHKPTGTVVQCDSERSQHRNREIAWRDLEKYLTKITPAAAPVPDAITGDDESPEYRTGWNECRETLLNKLATPPAAQRQWVGLTDEERDDVLDIYITAEGRARAIEAKLKELNT
jgi:hypothetical protein